MGWWPSRIRLARESNVTAPSPPPASQTRPHFIHLVGTGVARAAGSGGRGRAVGHSLEDGEASGLPAALAGRGVAGPDAVLNRASNWPVIVSI